MKQRAFYRLMVKIFFCVQAHYINKKGRKRNPHSPSVYKMANCLMACVSLTKPMSRDPAEQLSLAQEPS